MKHHDAWGNKPQGVSRIKQGGANRRGVKESKNKKKPVRHLLPNVLFVKHGSQIAPPIASGPASALLQETRVVLEGSQHLRLRVVLHISFPTMRNHPAGDKVIIVGVELVLPPPPLLIGESVSEALILQDSRPIRNRASRHAGKATVHMGRCAAVEVPALQVQGAEEAPDALGEGGLASAAEALAGDDAAVLLVLFERSQDPGEEGAGPAHVVIGQEGDGGADFGDGAGHLTALVGVHDGEETDSGLGGWHGAQHLLGLLAIGFDGHQEQFEGLIVEDSADGLDQLVPVAV